MLIKDQPQASAAAWAVALHSSALAVVAGLIHLGVEPSVAVVKLYSSFFSPSMSSFPSLTCAWVNKVPYVQM